MKNVEKYKTEYQSRCAEFCKKYEIDETFEFDKISTFVDSANVPYVDLVMDEYFSDVEKLVKNFKTVKNPYINFIKVETATNLKDEKERLKHNLKIQEKMKIQKQILKIQKKNLKIQKKIENSKKNFEKKISMNSEKFKKKIENSRRNVN